MHGKALLPQDVFLVLLITSGLPVDILKHAKEQRFVIWDAAIVRPWGGIILKITIWPIAYLVFVLIHLYLFCQEPKKIFIVTK